MPITTPVQAKVRFRADIQIVYEESVTITPGTATPEHNSKEGKRSLKEGFTNWVIPQLEQSVFFNDYRYLEASPVELREKAPLRIEHKRCGDCKGSGKAKCTKCGGSAEVTCSRCAGRGSVTASIPTSYQETTYSAAPNCPLCGGSGFVSVASSDGMGVTSKPCPANHGTVQKAYTSNKYGSTSKTVKCSSCNGRGKSKCKSCNNGYVGACKTCQGQTRVTETYNVQQKAHIKLSIESPKWLKRYKKLILKSTIKNHSLITETGRSGTHPKYCAIADVRLELEPYGHPIDPWSIRDRRTGTVWTKPPVLWEKIIGWFGFPAKPPFSQIK